MTWATRRERLKFLKSEVCFQVFIGVTKKTVFTTDEEFNTAATKNDIALTGESFIGLPQVNFMEEMFDQGWAFNDKVSGKKEINLLRAEPLITVAPYRVVGHDLSSMDTLNDLDKSNAAKDYKRVMAQYLPEITARHPLMNFGISEHAYADDIGVHFKYIVRPFDPQNCHPRELGVLKPITLIGDKPINPAVQKIDF